MQLIILGMHRSGTSVLARILNLMGAYLGPEGMSTGANAENPKGFWERRDVRLLNDALLHSAGCDWNRVADLDLAGVPAAMRKAFDEVASRTLLDMDAHRPWFIKEPRLCVLLPMWLRHLEVPVIVNVHRHPVEVAASLERRNGIPIPAGLDLWEYYTRAAAVSARDLPAVTVLHADLMTDPVGAALRLHRELVALGVEGIRPAARRELAGFIDPKLHRERKGRTGLEQYQDCRQTRIYDALAAGESGWLETWPPGDLAALRVYEQNLPAVPRADLAVVRASRPNVFKMNQRLDAHIREQAARIAELERLVAGVGVECREVAADLTRECQRSAVLEGRLAELLSSSSWRITAPLRAVASSLRAVLRRRQM